MANFAEMNAVWDAWVSPGNTPARATVEAKLAAPDYKVEIMVVRGEMTQAMASRASWRFSTIAAPAARPSSRNGSRANICSSGWRCPAFCSAGGTRRFPAPAAISIFIWSRSPAVLTSKPYLERLDNPTPMTKKIMSEIFINMNRTVCHRTLRRGGFRGAYAVTARFNEAPDIGTLTRYSTPW